ncbi:hypothetical protein [Brucella pituitosa]|uniref:hypothetical protein n=1 Tax=Brucella pituitosa TaxID=571256 RepID=UPI0009A229B5|nr:hypothetical protein [Brucella pituitosa]
MLHISHGSVTYSFGVLAHNDVGLRWRSHHQMSDLSADHDENYRQSFQNGFWLHYRSHRVYGKYDRINPVSYQFQ